MPFQSSKFGASGFCGGIAESRLVGDELEQPLEAQVVAQHLGERAAGRAGSPRRCARHAVGHGEARRARRRSRSARRAAAPAGRARRGRPARGGQRREGEHGQRDGGASGPTTSAGTGPGSFEASDHALSGAGRRAPRCSTALWAAMSSSAAPLGCVTRTSRDGAVRLDGEGHADRLREARLDLLVPEHPDLLLSRRRGTSRRRCRCRRGRRGPAGRSRGRAWRMPCPGRPVRRSRAVARALPTASGRRRRRLRRAPRDASRVGRGQGVRPRRLGRRLQHAWAAREQPTRPAPVSAPAPVRAGPQPLASRRRRAASPP